MGAPAYTEKEYQEDLTRARDERCVPIAQQIVTMMASYEGGLLGDAAKDSKIKESYDALAKDILKLLYDKNVGVSEVNFIHQMLNTLMEATMGVVTASLNHSLKEMEVQVIGKAVRDLTFQELDKLLKGEKLVV